MTKKPAKKQPKKCFSCGRCCTSCDLMLGAVPDDEKQLEGQMRWIQLHHCDTWVRTNGNVKQLMVRIPLLCVNLDYDTETRRYKCRDYANRPEICRTYKCYK